MVFKQAKTPQRDIDKLLKIGEVIDPRAHLVHIDSDTLTVSIRQMSNDYSDQKKTGKKR